MAATAFPTGMEPLPSDYDTWLSVRDAALASWAALSRARSEFTTSDNAMTQASERLRLALARARVPADPEAQLDELLAISRAALEVHIKRHAERDQYAKLVTDLRRREHDEREAQQAFQTWSIQWQDALQGTWLEDSGENDPQSVGDILNHLSTLSNHIKNHAALGDRIRKMEDDQVAFGAALDRLDAHYAMPGDRRLPLARFQTMSERADKAQRAEDDKARISGELKELSVTETTLDCEEADCHSRIRLMTNHYGVDTIDEVIGCIAKAVERDGLGLEVDKARRAVLEAMKSESLEECKEELSRASKHELEAQLTGLDERHDAQNDLCQQLYAAVTQAENAFNALGGDDKAAILDQQARTKCLEIEEKAMDYLKLRAGILATERALSHYRALHQSSMMQSASEAFAKITNNRYVQLQSQLIRNAERLVAISADGTSKSADQLSKGTRFQLYLALRAAGFEEFARTRAPVPFIADDILETFDDPRSGKAFAVLGQLAQLGQVIYLTHHGHICEFAKNMIPSVKIHNLPK
jgi:uncharacterized protein YhaN